MDKYGLELSPAAINTLWVNITHRCNQTCHHCHVNASPQSTEQMELNGINRCLEILAQHQSCATLDITGGAPELNPNFGYFVKEAIKLKKHVVVRHNLTITSDENPLTGENYYYLPSFYAEYHVELLASLPHYTRQIADEERGNGVFNKSIAGIRQLNSLGYGKENSGLILNLVYNHSGPISQAERESLEAAFKTELSNRYELVFNKLYAVTNMPINRYLSRLQQSGEYESYMHKLADAFISSSAERVACRSLISVGYDGKIYDCDFNQMLGMQIYTGKAATIFDTDIGSLLNRKIQFGPHCFGCTAGGGSS
ncbi:arsenosugar biosynthesis radical SAM (seleno)protein ArsS [Chloroflexota bacterium]